MHNDDSMIGRLLTRRELVALFGASAVAAMAHRVSGQAAQAGAGPAGLPACVVVPQQTEGPYFVDEKLLRSDIRADSSTGAVKAGAPLALAIKVSQVTPEGAALRSLAHRSTCGSATRWAPIPTSSDKLFDTSGQKFLRGHQITDSAGGVKFVTIYPGWYPGRAVHIHFKVRTSPAGTQAYEFTSQFYFDETFTDRVHAGQPYATHSGQRTRNERDGIYKDGGPQLTLAVAEAAAGGYQATFDLAMKPGDRAGRPRPSWRSRV